MVHNPFTSNNSLNIGSKNVDKGNLSITVTGDGMFGRKMPSVLSSGESPYRYVSNITGQSDILLVNTENPLQTVEML